MHPLRGISLKISSVLVFICMATCIKASSAHVPVGQAVFFRSLFAVPVIFVWLAWRRELSTGLGTSNPLGHVWRGLVGTSGMILGFAALGLLPLPEATALGYTAPLLTVIFASMFLGEQVRAFRITAVVLGLIGVLIVLSPRLTRLSDGEVSTTDTLGAVLALSAALCAALAQVFVRRMVVEETTSSIVFWFSITATLLSLITIPFGWVIPAPREIALLVAAGLLGGVGQILLTSSYRWADASVVAPFEYVSMLFALLFGYVIFSEVPSLTMIGGASLVVLAGILIIWRERKIGIERAKQRESMTP